MANEYGFRTDKSKIGMADPATIGMLKYYIFQWQNVDDIDVTVQANSTLNLTLYTAPEPMQIGIFIPILKKSFVQNGNVWTEKNVGGISIYLKGITQQEGMPTTVYVAIGNNNSYDVMVTATLLTPFYIGRQ